MIPGARRQRGFTLVETAIAVALLAVIVISVLSAFSAITVAANRHQGQASLDLLVRSDAEYIKSQLYQVKPAGYSNLSKPGYTLSSQALYWDPNTATFSTTNNENGLQEVVLTGTAPHGGTETLRILKVQP